MIHGAIPNYISSNPLVHLDYKSQYPSTILQYKEFFGKFINIKLYEQIYNLKEELSIKIKELEKENKSFYKKINDGGNDFGDICDYAPIIEDNELQIKKIKILIKGTKLILNTAYGIINSNFKLSISNKIMGRFVCLKGQSLLINLIDKLGKCLLDNVNTDGIIIEIDKIIECEWLPKLIESDENRYYKLGVNYYKELIQSDVNNYILIDEKGYAKLKGKYKVGIKKQINTTEIISNNIENAVRLIQGKEIEIKPIYFNTKYIGEAKPYYFNWKGSPLVKNLKQPTFLTINGEKMLFSDTPDLETYEEYAEITKQKILNFTLNTSNKKEVLKYYEYELIEDLENYKNKSSIKRKYMKLLSKKIGISGFKNDLKSDCIYFEGDKQRIITPLSNYTMTDVMKSTDCLALTLHDLIIIDIDIYNKNTGKAKTGWQQIKNLLSLLKESGTFEVENKKTKGFNKKFIFKGDLDFKIDNKYFEVVKKGVIYSFDGFYSNNDVEPIELPENIKKELKKYEKTINKSIK